MNLIPKITEMLEVEIGEEFKLKFPEWEDSSFYYKFTETSLVFTNEPNRSKGVWFNKRSCDLIEILNGNAKIVKLPFKPNKLGDIFYAYFINDDEIRQCKWIGSTDDLALRYCGDCFRTYKEAEKHKPEIYEKLTGEKWEYDDD